MRNPPAAARVSPVRLAHIILTGLAAVLASCGGGAARGAGTATEADWRTLASERPAPLPDAVRLAFTEVDLLSDPQWSLQSPVPLTLGLSELVVAGLLRRPDVHFVERRRFESAVAAERNGARRPGAPAAGISPGAEVVASVVWVPLGPGDASLELRLADAQTGAIVASRRGVVPRDADLVGLARSVVATLLGALRDSGRLPAWSDPIATAAPSAYADSGTPDSAVADFLEGLAAEEAWNWERARQAYQAAARSVGFFEASVALARTARLRLGGTLGES